MFENKYQIIRYNTLDKCFQNFGKEYSIEELLDAVNEVLTDYSSTSIQVRQLRKDIAFMRSSAGYDAPIETIKGANGYCYRYDDKKFSINKSPLNKTEAEQLKNAVGILQRFQGSPEFEWFTLPALSNKASKAILSNLSYQFFGKVNDPDTAKYYERFFEIVKDPTKSISRGHNLDFDTRITTGEKEIPKIRADVFFRLK